MKLTVVRFVSGRGFNRKELYIEPRRSGFSPPYTLRAIGPRPVHGHRFGRAGKQQLKHTF